jgi:hypothetical protein
VLDSAEGRKVYFIMMISTLDKIKEGNYAIMKLTSVVGVIGGAL